MSEHETTALSQVSTEIQRAAGLEEKVNNEQEDLFLRFLNGNVIDTEESANLANQEDFDTVPDISPERASYNSLEALSLDDSFSSLDELTRRIEITEVNIVNPINLSCLSQLILPSSKCVKDSFMYHFFHLKSIHI